MVCLDADTVARGGIPCVAVAPSAVGLVESDIETAVRAVLPLPTVLVSGRDTAVPVRVVNGKTSVPRVRGPHADGPCRTIPRPRQACGGSYAHAGGTGARRIDGRAALVISVADADNAVAVAPFSVPGGTFLPDVGLPIKLCGTPCSMQTPQEDTTLPCGVVRSVARTVGDSQGRAVPPVAAGTLTETAIPRREV